ncbi:hypothetical protein OE903_01965 [Bacillus sp. B6(2022)]|nr:hypothetical protein [Bacillus sp. B6(2022)]
MTSALPSITTINVIGELKGLEIVEKQSHLKIKHDAFAEDHVDIKRSACLKE